ncbi:hypothetical protein P0D69_33010 [Paraburkholderia sediminicola]|uniref:hypothetical protein n=1 Tax=Paraburkholderia sediminicola TaxID=458836 RepID=UPI0038BA500A
MKTARTLQWRQNPVGTSGYFPLLAKTDNELLAQAAYVEVVAWANRMQGDKSAGIGRIRATQDFFDVTAGKYDNPTIIGTEYVVYLAIENEETARQFKKAVRGAA